MSSEPGRSVMVFYPTLEEMKDFSKYIETIEKKGAHIAGIAKVISLVFTILILAIMYPL